ncbi:MAG: multicopper oxidase domain-containing protein [Betaproteobacteria bacterium]|nr:multicopper oxidase domain-containing protein [Betaproteobacteria bacterium]
MVRSMLNVDRRKFIQTIAAGGALLAAGKSAFPAEMAHGAASEANPDFKPDVEIELAATPGELPLLPGASTRVWQFKGSLIKGDPAAFQMLPGTALPVIRVRNGQKLRIHFANHLNEDSIVHWHGLHLPHQMDGHPMYAIRPGQRFVYEFQVDNRAGTYWFHPHPHGRTGEQVYRGLAGLFIVSDDEEQAAALPSGEFDLAWVLQDRLFDHNNQLVYARNMMERMQGFLGDRVLINGKPDFVQPVATTAYRIRLLNGSNSRIYKLAWDDGRPLTVIGNDGGLLERPVKRPYVTLAPAERVELWMNFSDRSVGDQITLRSLPFNAGMSMGGAATANGSAFPVLRVRVDRKLAKPHALPARLSHISRYRLEDAVNHRSPRTFSPAMGMGRVSLNGRTFEKMDEVADNEIVKLNTLEVWEFANDASMMMMAHPIHVHNLQFQVLERRADPRFAAIRDSLGAGFLDEGWKDVVLVMPGERVKLLMKFTDHTGLYLYHCHILEHEDMGMMRNYLVRA